MAADVSSWARMLERRREDAAASSAGNSDILITRDLLGTLSNSKNREIHFDDLKLQNSPNSPLPSSLISKNKKEEESSSSACSSFSDSKLQDLNYPPRNFFLDEKSLDLKLQSSLSSTNSTNYQSVCTLDKVKFALERAEKETSKKRPPWLPVSPPSSYSSPSKMFATACPGCLLYVMTSSANPRCPRCNSFVQAAAKKPRIDLNAAF
ncbi:hypothetical protein SLEP1_g21108 [Rubroshorea leprosula]|uniref:GIR1-like zinc ribbon domain-containing protein n=1 Tax=Rubroshorea leprosula TaxID=152421 RepID=A0AAV5JE44_9ROSI|nr:hypothetical protein SLEP1_g21108 [Rubroshorea leprosula]